MDIRKEAVREYLEEGIPYRALAKKYGVNRTTINRWVLVHQGIHDIPRSHKQITYDLQQKTLGKKSKQVIPEHQSELEKKVALLEKQLDGSGAILQRCEASLAHDALQHHTTSHAHSDAL